MSKPVQWVLELDIKDGSLETFKELLDEMVTATNTNEPGALIYEWFIGEDDKNCHINERYADSEAAMTHIASFGRNFAKRILELCVPARMTVYGDSSSEVRDALAGFDAVHMAQIGGFAR